MSNIAVLLCMAGDTPESLVRRALHSTAAGLELGDQIFLMVDGGCSGKTGSFEELCRPIPLKILSSPDRKGLAAGLNRLINAVLSEPGFHFLARMDADDESLPNRFQAQREFLDNHPEVDILGGGCREVDENGTFLQEKRMPAMNAQILTALPRRNPINHPTVVVRRRVFESGLRYRENVGRMEDYHLWVDAAERKFVFANLPFPVLNFRRDQSFFNRRGGWTLARAEFAVRWRAMAVTQAWTPVNMAWAVAAMILRALPARLQQFFYRSLR